MSGRFGGLMTALMCALAGGAVWCVIALAAGRELAVLALPVAAVVAWALRTHGFAASRLGAVLAVVSTGVACFYAQYLLAAAEVASTFGLPFREGLTRSGFDMITALMLRRLDPLDWSIFAAAAVFAGLLVVRRRR